MDCPQYGTQVNITISRWRLAWGVLNCNTPTESRRVYIKPSKTKPHWTSWLGPECLRFGCVLCTHCVRWIWPTTDLLSPPQGTSPMPDYLAAPSITGIEPAVINATRRKWYVFYRRGSCIFCYMGQRGEVLVDHVTPWRGITYIDLDLGVASLMTRMGCSLVRRLPQRHGKSHYGSHGSLTKHVLLDGRHQYRTCISLWGNVSLQ